MDVLIRRLDCTYQIPAMIERAEEAQRRLDRVAKELLGNALEQRFAGMEGLGEPGAGEPLIFIERMEADVSLGAALAEDRIVTDDYSLAAKWAVGLQDAIRKALQGSGVVVFPSRGEYLASYIRDRLAGRDGGLWYYAEFEPLHGQADDAVFRKILVEDADAGRDALLTLARGDSLDRVLNVLSDETVEAVVAACLLPPAPPLRIANTTHRWLEGLQSLLSVRKPRLTGEPNRDLARLYLLLLADRPGLGPDVHLARFLNDLLSLRRALPDGGLDLARRLESGDWPRARQVAAKYPALLAQIQADRSGSATAGVLRQMASGSRGATGSQSPFAGALLLLPAAFELDLYHFFVGLLGVEGHGVRPSPDGGLPSLLFLGVLAQVLGETAASHIWSDTALCRVLGLQSPPGFEAVERLVQAVTAQQPEAQALRPYWEAHWDALAYRRGFFWRTGGEPNPEPSYEGLAEIRPSQDSQPIAIQRLNSLLRPISARLAQRFASTLGNFAASSLPYLRRNFLDGTGEIEFTSGRIVCRLPDRPLALVLKMAGIENRPVPLPWVPAVDLEFRLE